MRTDDGKGTSGPSCDVPDVGHKKPSGTKSRKKRRIKGGKSGKKAGKERPREIEKFCNCILNQCISNKMINDNKFYKNYNENHTYRIYMSWIYLKL